MKLLLLLLVILFFFSASAQQPVIVDKKEVPKYVPVKLEKFKKFNSSPEKNNADTKTPSSFISLSIPENTSFNFSPLQQYLSEDMRQYKAQKNYSAWTEFTSGMLSSYRQEKWFQNKNNIQQRWMVQKAKGK